ncbi:Gfo/Idh/MocA family protein [Brucellaceae bacterium C25G]
MFRWGILSTAKIGINQVIPAITASENGIVYAIASRDLTKARDIAERFGVPYAFGSYEELIACHEIDGIYIPLPTSQHIEWALKAANAGKHVLCEKPIALQASQIDDLITARDHNKVVISEAFMVYYHPQWIKLRELLQEGVIGTLRRVEGVFTYHNTDPENMRNKPELGGGGLPDIGVYPVVTARISTGMEPSRIRAQIEFDPVFKTDRYASVEAEFEGFDLSFYISTQLSYRQSMIFHGDKGYIEMLAPFNPPKYDHARIEVHNITRDTATTYSFQNINQYQLQVETFVRKARGAPANIFSLENSKGNQHFIDKVYEAGKKGNWTEV